MTMGAKYSAFSNAFKHLRAECGYSQESIAKALCISRSAVGMYESGKRIPNCDDLCRIADFFDVSVDYLLGRSKNKPFFFDSPQLYALFKAARDARPDDLQKATDYLEATAAMALELNHNNEEY